MQTCTADKLIEILSEQAKEEYSRIQKEIYVRIESRDRMFNSLLFIIAATIGAIAWIVRPTGSEQLPDFLKIDLSSIGLQLFLIAMILSGSSLVCSAVCRGFLESNAHIYAAGRYAKEQILIPVQNLLIETNKNLGRDGLSVIPKWDWESFITRTREEQGFSDKSHGSISALVLVILIFIIISVAIDYEILSIVVDQIKLHDDQNKTLRFPVIIEVYSMLGVAFGVCMVICQVASSILLFLCFRLQRRNESYIKTTAG